MIRPRVEVTFEHNRLPALLRAAPARAGRVVYQTALAVERDAKLACPVDTGRLRASIHAQLTGPATAEIGTNTGYGVYVELGYHHAASGAYIPGRPYLVPALERHLPAFRRAMTRLLDGGGPA
jgi:phage gpG-like protein